MSRSDSQKKYRPDSKVAVLIVVDQQSDNTFAEKLAEIERLHNAEIHVAEFNPLYGNVSICQPSGAGILATLALTTVRNPFRVNNEDDDNES